MAINLNNLPNANTLRDILEGYVETFHNTAYRITGVGPWFKAFIRSKEFASLDETLKGEALDNYENLKWVLEQMERACEEYECLKTDIKSNTE